MIELTLLAALLQAPARTPEPAPAPEFRCIVVTTIDPSLEDRWYHSSGEEGVAISSTDKFVLGQYFAIHTLFTGVRGDEDDCARVRLDVRIRKPDGAVYFAKADLPGLGTPVGDPRSVQLGESGFRVCFDPGDALGTYQLEVIARDLVADTTLTVAQSLEVVRYVEGDDFTDDAGLEAWFNGYFAAPDPRRAIPALRACVRNGWGAEKPRDARGFLREVFENNHWLFGELRPRFAKLDVHERGAVLWLLARSSLDPTEFLHDLGDDDRATWAALQKSLHDPLVEPIAGRADVNELWGMYLAARRYATIERLCLALAPDSTGVVASTSYHDAEHDVDVPLWLVVPRVVRDLLRATAKVDAPTRHYLEWMHDAKSVAQDVREQIDVVLE